jgi:mannose-6-phosphate isomerase-like protein (cupin superfamily)
MRVTTAEESYEILEGALEVCVDGEGRTVRAGEKATVPADVPHTLRNASAEPVRIETAERGLQEPRFRRASA